MTSSSRINISVRKHVLYLLVSQWEQPKVKFEAENQVISMVAWIEMNVAFCPCFPQLFSNNLALIVSARGKIQSQCPRRWWKSIKLCHQAPHISQLPPEVTQCNWRHPLYCCCSTKEDKRKFKEIRKFGAAVRNFQQFVSPVACVSTDWYSWVPVEELKLCSWVYKYIITTTFWKVSGLSWVFFLNVPRVRYEDISLSHLHSI